MSRALVAGMSLFSACLLFSGMAMAQSVESECDAVADNIVANCGFETGVYASEWTFVGNPNHVQVQIYAHSGRFGLEMRDGAGCLSQTLTTVPGQSYDLSYWLAQSDDPVITVLWNGVEIDRPFQVDYQPFTQRGVPGLIGTGADTLTFCDDGWYYFWLDDIVVIPSPATPR